jgi:hypothetical protein
LRRRYQVKVASEPGSAKVPGMGLAVARIAGQVVPGVEVARAWSAASARNGGGPARTPLPSSPPPSSQSWANVWRLCGIRHNRHYADGRVMCRAVAFPLLGAAEPVLQSA